MKIKLSLCDKDEKFKINLIVTDNKIKIKNFKGGDFVFENVLNINTIEKWEKIVKLFQKAIEIIKKEYQPCDKVDLLPSDENPIIFSWSRFLKNEDKIKKELEVKNK